jgi:putative endonuclease
MNKQYFVYLVTNKTRTVIYTGVTSDLRRRMWEHKQGLGKGFTKQCGAGDLVYFEVYEDIEAAIAREKQIKAGSRRKKEALLEAGNWLWPDLSERL